jgi:3alpha(or 20beta)-hydroxysteroid dehydrogenase
VTGAARGIGAAVATRLVDEGARVVLLDVLEDAGATLAAALGDRAAFIPLDVTDADAWAAAVDDATVAFGLPNVLVNNAGVLRYGPLEAVTPEEFRTVIDINLVGTFLGIRAVVPVLRQHADGGAIVNMSSTCGLQGSPFLAAYTASKWGIRGLTKTAALEYAADRIRVNSVHPGGIDTAMVRGDSSDADVAAMGDNLPLGRLGEAAEVAAMVAFLASPEAGFCTGGEYAVDGGYTAGDLSMVSWTREHRIGGSTATD